MPQSIHAIMDELASRTLVVGCEEDLRLSHPQVADQLLQYPHLSICGKLSEKDPVGELWSRISSIDAQRLWIFGGDGTINFVGECLLRNNHSLPCWLTPSGTANDLARSLSERFAQIAIPSSNAVMLSTRNIGSTAEQNLYEQIPDAAAAIDANVVQTLLLPSLNIDLLEVMLDHGQQKCCANMLTLGTSARNTQHVTDEIKSRWGALAYLTQFWRAISDLQPFTIKASVGNSDTKQIDGIVNLFVANGAYCGGGHRVAPLALIDDGLLNCVIIRPGTGAELAHLAASFLAGGHLEHNLVEHFTCESMSIESTELSPLTLDGETYEAKQIAIQVRPGFLPITLIDRIVI